MAQNGASLDRGWLARVVVTLFQQFSAFFLRPRPFSRLGGGFGRGLKGADEEEMKRPC